MTFQMKGESEPPKEIKKEQFPFQCDKCDKSYAAAATLYQHKNIHTDKFRCIVCGKRSASRANLVIHMRHHSREKPFGCQTCEYRYKSKLSLDRHKQTCMGKENKPAIKTAGKPRLRNVTEEDVSDHVKVEETSQNESAGERMVKKQKRSNRRRGRKSIEHDDEGDQAIERRAPKVFPKLPNNPNSSDRTFFSGPNGEENGMKRVKIEEEIEEFEGNRLGEGNKMKGVLEHGHNFDEADVIEPMSDLLEPSFDEPQPISVRFLSPTKFFAQSYPGQNDNVNRPERFEEIRPDKAEDVKVKMTINPRSWKMDEPATKRTKIENLPTLQNEELEKMRQENLDMKKQIEQLQLENVRLNQEKMAWMMQEIQDRKKENEEKTLENQKLVDAFVKISEKVDLMSRQQKNMLVEPGNTLSQQEFGLKTQCAFCSSTDHSSESCRKCSFLEWRHAHCKSRSLCKLCLIFHPGRICLTGSACRYCQDKTHHPALCPSKEQFLDQLS